MNALPHKEPIARSILNASDEFDRMLLSLALFRPRKEVERAIMSAYTADDWDWRKSDGCTGVSEMYFPKGFRFPPCVMHDHRCDIAARAKTKRERNELRAEGDRLFLLAMRDYGVARWRARARWIGVRFYWNTRGRWMKLETPQTSGRACCCGL